MVTYFSDLSLLEQVRAFRIVEGHSVTTFLERGLFTGEQWYTGNMWGIK